MNRSRDELYDRLVRYVKKIRKNKHKAVTIKSMGAFKECKNFYAKLNFWDNGTIVLHIDCRNIQNHFDCCGTAVFCHKLEKDDPDNIKQTVLEALYILERVKFSVADGLFFKEGEELPGTEFKELMNELWGVNEDLECCVCQEKTVTKTPCGHKLCILCWSIINETKPRCPMCRMKIDYFEKDPATDSESESEN
jgi:hypothetical protein